MKMRSKCIVLMAMMALGGCMTQDTRSDSGTMGGTSQKEMGKPGDETHLSRCRNPCSIQPGPGCC